MNIACYIRNVTVFDQVTAALAHAGFLTERFDTEIGFLRGLRRRHFDIIIVAEMRPAPSGDNVFSWLSFRSGNRTPTLVLSPFYSADLVAFALDNGADDYLCWPFEDVELVARMNALLRRSMPLQSPRTIELQGFRLERERYRFSFLGRELDLTPREFEIAWLLFSAPGEYLSRETLCALIWSSDRRIAGRTIDQHVYKLRKKLQAFGYQSIGIRTAYSHGYRLELYPEFEEHDEMPQMALPLHA
jgi:DNA-binding response OmpR family regulator